MAVFANNQSRTAAANRSQDRKAEGGNRRRNDDDFIPSVNWANIGWNVELLNPDTGEYEQIFISFGGVPFDNVQEPKVGNVNSRGGAIAYEKSVLIRETSTAFDQLEPGGEIEVPLVVRLRKAAEGADVSKTDNELVRNRPTLFAAE